MIADNKKILILGSGALKIGEAGEFDYSGTQALKALREEGIATILVNPNIATVQTSEGLADKIYFLPVLPYYIGKVIEKERPDSILLSFGGQTALNCGIELYKSGMLDTFGIKVLGTPMKAIIETEDRNLFARNLRAINIKTPNSIAVTSIAESLEASDHLGFPVIIRAAFTLGGQGSGICSSRNELMKLAEMAFSYSGQILVEESLKGWKEIEYEVVRDRYDNCVTVCNMENIDPLGIHTGESIVVAPSQTLNNSEYYALRRLSIDIVRSFDIVGECNVQFALDPCSEDYRVIEVNARLSRSSALASKATGYPLAFVSAKLALGYGLHELKNAVTRTTTALFEPALDYVAVKVPRWDLNKFIGVSKEIGSGMKSVGEVMAIGRTFEEAIQKGLRMAGQSLHGFVGNNDIEIEDIDRALSAPTDMRIYAIAGALEAGYTVERVHDLTNIDRWFLTKFKSIYDMMIRLKSYNRIEELPTNLLTESKQKGFSDFQIARFVTKKAGNLHDDMLQVRRHRQSMGVVPRIKQIDTLAAEYPAVTNYLYLTYSADSGDITPENDRKSVIVLGSGAYRIGSSVEFDWCSVNALMTASVGGYRCVMINCNPETVSTDHDICDRLYFEELSFERVMDIIELEEPGGVVVSTGGQVANNLAMRLHRQGVPILGTPPESIDRAENRHKFSLFLDNLGIDQPRWSELTALEDIHRFVDKVGLPVLVRPSYVLSGAAMNVVSNKQELEHFLALAARVSKEYPVVISEFIQNAKELEIDAVAEKGEIIAYAISEHIEFAGVHSGDATIVFPAQKIYLETARRVKRISRDIARALNISGPFNIQFLARDNNIKVIECNLRASRNLPFVAKVLKVNFIELAMQIMLDLPLKRPDASAFDVDYIGVKAPQFSFSRLVAADPVLGVEMASTGEVGCIGDSFYEALLMAMLSVGYSVPKKNIFLSTGDACSKAELLQSARMLVDRGYDLYATPGSARYLMENGVLVVVLHWPDDDAKPNALEYLRKHKVDLVINIPKSLSKTELDNDYIIRRSAIDCNIPLITNTRLASAFIYAICNVAPEGISVRSWNEY